MVHEPVHRFRIEAPADTLGALLPVLGSLGALPRTTDTLGALCVLEGTVPRRGCGNWSSGCRGRAGARAS